MGGQSIELRDLYLIKVEKEKTTHIRCMLQYTLSIRVLVKICYKLLYFYDLAEHYLHFRHTGSKESMVLQRCFYAQLEELERDIKLKLGIESQIAFIYEAYPS